MSHSTLRGITATAVKALVSVALIAFALRGTDLRAVASHFGNVEPASVAAAVAITTGISLLHARRWELVLLRMEHPLRFSEALKLVLIGYFFNQTLPSTVGGDAYRAWGAYKGGVHGSNSIVSVLVDRAFGVVSLFLMIGAGGWWLSRLVSSPFAHWAIAGVCVAGPLGFAALLGLPRFALMRRWRATRFVLHVSEGAGSVMKSGSTVAQIVLLSMGGYAMFSYVVYLLAGGLGVELSLGYALLFVPLVTLVTLLPVSIAGWGLRESAMVISLGLIGVPAEKAFSLSVLLGLVVMASGIPGGILWLMSRWKRDASVPARHAEESP